MALIIAITYSLSDDSNNIDPTINTAVNTVNEARISVTTEDGIVDPVRILNATEIFTILLGTNWPLAGNKHFYDSLLFTSNFCQFLNRIPEFYLIK